ncbi:MAG: sensor histidine kinase [Candidatus Thorarchaeota archaeon]
MYETALFTAFVSAVCAAYGLGQYIRSRNGIDMALVALALVMAARSLLLYGYFNSPTGSIAYSVFRAADFAVETLEVPLGLQIARANIVARVNQSMRVIYITAYAVSFSVPGAAAVTVFLAGVDTARIVMAVFGFVGFSLLFVLLTIFLRSNPYKVERPELVRGGRLVLAGYVVIFLGEGVGAGFLREIDMAFMTLAFGMVMIVTGCIVMRTVTFAGIYARLKSQFILVYGDSRVEMTNLAGYIEEGQRDSIGVRAAKKIVEELVSDIRKVLRTGSEVVISQTVLDALDPNRIYQVDIVPHTRTPDGRVVSVLIIMSDVTKSIEERENAQLRELLYKIARERDKVVLYADLLKHDMSNIVQSVQMAIDLAKYSVGDTDTLNEALDMAQEGIDRARKTIRDVRLVSEVIDKDRVELNPINIEEVVERAVTRVRSLLKDKRLAAGFKVNPKGLMIRGEPMIEQCFVNLLRRCVNDNLEKSRVNIVIQKEPDEKAVQVEFIAYDVVLHPQEKEKMFQWRSETATPGEGLALPLVRAIVELHGGEVWVEDRVEGQPEHGTKFVIKLPIADGSDAEETG